MTTTNALMLMLRSADLKKPSDYSTMPIIEKGRAEMMEFGAVLDRIGTKASSEKVETTPDYRTSDSSQISEIKDEKMVQKEEFGSKISEKIKSKEVKEVDEALVAEVMGNFNEKMIALLTETLNISPEELLTGLKELDLTLNDLLEPSNLANLFVHFGEDVSVTDILMSDEFLIVKNQMEVFNIEMSQELGISEQDIEKFIADYEQNFSVEHEEKQGTDTEVAVEVVDEQALATEKNIPKNENPVSEDTVDDSTQEQVDVRLEQPQADTEGDTAGGAKKELDFGQTKSNFKQETPNEMIREDMNGQTVKHHVFTTSGGEVVQETVKIVDLQNMVRELTDYVRLTSGNELSKIEMQLNPANLGKMIVEVTSSQGEVTAKIVAQTEAGKEAIESSITQMRTNLEQQGVKVAAVEVTVESHAFEQNLQGESSKEQEQLMKEQQQDNKKHHMNLNELTLDDLAGLMSEEEMLTVRMMRENGNNIDLTV